MIIVNNKTKFLNFFRRIFRFPLLEYLLIQAIITRSFLGELAIKIAPSNYLYSKGTFRYTKVNGVDLKLDISDYVNHYVYFNFVDKGLDHLLSVASNFKVVFDVGANIGYTALRLSQELEQSGIVYAFEPDPYNFKRLEENVNLNPQSSINIERYGLGNQEGRLKLAVVTTDNLGGNRISIEADGDYNWIDITTIDIFCTKHQLSMVDLIKIDVEGFEFNVLKGAEQLILNLRPILYVEIDDINLSQQGTSAKELVRFLELYYTKIYDAETLDSINSQYNFTNRHFDIIAIYED